MIDKFTEQLKEINIQTNEIINQNRILIKALELACETIEAIMPKKPMYICGDYFAKKYNIPNTPTIKDFDYFIQQAKESLYEK